MNPSKTPVPPTVVSPSIVPEYPEVDWKNIVGWPVSKRSVVIHHHKTSMSIEGPYWSRLLKLAADCKLTVSEMIELIEEHHNHNLSSTVRLYLFDSLRVEIEELLGTINRLNLRIERLKAQNQKLRGIADIDTDETEEARP